MTERVLKNIMAGVCVFLTVVIAAYVLYGYIRQGGEHGADTPTAETSADVRAASDSKSDDNIAVPDSGGYIARINDNALAIYAVKDGREEFLYNLKVRLEDISDAEKQNLAAGIRLSNKKALASFEEDFTS